jgi:hypothetical protein
MLTWRVLLERTRGDLGPDHEADFLNRPFCHDSTETVPIRVWRTGAIAATGCHCGTYVNSVGSFRKRTMLTTGVLLGRTWEARPDHQADFLN